MVQIQLNYLIMCCVFIFSKKLVSWLIKWPIAKNNTVFVSSFVYRWFWFVDSLQPEIIRNLLDIWIKKLNDHGGRLHFFCIRGPLNCKLLKTKRGNAAAHLIGPSAIAARRTNPPSGTSPKLDTVWVVRKSVWGRIRSFPSSVGSLGISCVQPLGRRSCDLCMCFLCVRLALCCFSDRIQVFVRGFEPAAGVKILRPRPLSG